jgi:protein N-terminal glutamine amidohydrolase
MKPNTYKYAPYYCEENIWHLCQEQDFASFERKVVFISNSSRTCALWNQRASSAADEPVIWDYHVILLFGQKDGWQVFDLDTTLPSPSSVTDYLSATFGEVSYTPEQFCPFFRVIDAQIFVDVFSSDRSHMLTADGNWQVAPPTWKPIFRNESSNLMELVDMGKSSAGTVMNYLQFEEYFV